MALQDFFPCIPQYMTWEDWNCNVVLYFGAQPIAHGPETEWQSIAKNICQLPFFEVYPVPDPTLYNHWQDWATDFTLIINGPSH